MGGGNKKILGAIVFPDSVHVSVAGWLFHLSLSPGIRLDGG